MGSVLEYHAGPDVAPLRIYLSGDTVPHDELRTIREHFPDLDLAVVHLGGTRAFGVLVTLDHRGGVDLLNLLEPCRAGRVPPAGKVGCIRHRSGYQRADRLSRRRDEVHVR
jgi:hypothetical protein